MKDWSSKQDGARQLFLYYAMHADLGDTVSRSPHRYSTHARGDGPAYKIHRLTIELPDGHPEKSLRERQAWLFDRLCEHLDEDGELLDHFATKLMERLGERTKLAAKSWRPGWYQTKNRGTFLFLSVDHERALVRLMWLDGFHQDMNAADLADAVWIAETEDKPKVSKTSPRESAP